MPEQNKVRSESPMAGPGGKAPPIDETEPEALERQRVLGSRLKQMFDHVVDESVPDDFLDLLDKLDGPTGKRP